jgi:hypothetical protein
VFECPQRFPVNVRRGGRGYVFTSAFIFTWSSWLLRLDYIPTRIGYESQ